MSAELVADLSAAEKRALLKRLIEKQRSFPLSAGQRRLWFLHQIASDSAAYNFPVALRIARPFDESVLRRSIEKLFQRHSIFRAVFQEIEGKLVQSYADADALHFEVVDASSLNAEQLRLAVNSRAEQPFDLACGPVFRCTLFACGGADAVLLLVWHHIVLDGWSLALALDELGEIHSALIAGVEPTLAAPTDYREFVKWQHEMLRSEEGKRHAKYWQDSLENATRLDLPTDFPRPAQRSYRGGVITFTLAGTSNGALTDFAAANHTTPFVLLLTAFQILLHRVTGQVSVPVTFPVNGRTASKFDQTAGYFVNQVAVNAALEPGLTVRELVSANREAVLGALAHQDYPLSLLSSDGNNEDIPQRVADVMFVLQKSQGFQLDVSGDDADGNFETGVIGPKGRANIGGLHVASYPLNSGTSRFDLELHMMESADVLTGWLMYDAAIFNPQTARGYAQCFEHAVASVIGNADQRVSSVDVLGAELREKLLSGYNGTGRAWSGNERDMVDLFGEALERFSGQIAVCEEDISLTYSDVERQSNQIANWLHRVGARTDDVVAVHMTRSPKTLSAILGAIKAGCLYLPLDPSNPRARVKWMLDDSCSRFVIADGEASDLLSRPGATLLNIGSLQDTLSDLPDSAPRVERSKLLNLVYTSGSSGEPKGVLGTHLGYINRLNWQWEQFPFALHETCVQLTTLSFVDSVTEIFGALLAGVRIVVVPDDVARDVHRLASLLHREHITRITLVPSLLRVLLEVDDADSLLGGIHYWFCSGEALDAELARRFHERLPQARLVNLYGCSEASADSSFHEIMKGFTGDRVPIGRPIANSSIFILDADCNLLPPGSVGEIHIGGAGVSAGYMGREKLTNERFVQSPFSQGERLYKTGDLGRFRSDGSIEYFGRMDRQLKIRGNRVESGEVEAALRSYRGVDSVAVTSVREESGDHALIAYVVLDPRISNQCNPGTTSPIASLRAHVAGLLPSFMVPSHLVFLERLPLTASGKINARALPAPDLSSWEIVAPTTLMELQVAEIWAGALGLERISVLADFFDLGGHSILALTVSSQLSRQLRRNVPVALTFQYPTVRQLAAHLEASEFGDTRHRLVTIDSKGSGTPLFWVPGGVGALGFVKLKRLASAIGPDQPFHGFATQWASTLREVESVEERAAEYVKLMRAVQPVGPYNLVGFCLGGVIAFEMARQLDADGQSVNFLSLVNSWMPADAIKKHQWLMVFAQRAVYYGKYALRQREVSVGKFIFDRARNLIRIIRGTHYADVRGLLDQTSPENEREELLEQDTTFRATLHLARRYKPQRFSGRLNIFVSAETEVRGVSAMLDPRRAWRRVCASCEIVDVPGGHMPNLDFLGAELRKALLKARHDHRL